MGESHVLNDRAELLASYAIVLADLNTEGRLRGLALQRAERAEATLAAVRAWVADTERAEAEAENNGYASAQDDVRALLDRTPTP